MWTGAKSVCRALIAIASCSIIFLINSKSDCVVNRSVLSERTVRIVKIIILILTNIFSSFISLHFMLLIQLWWSLHDNYDFKPNSISTCMYKRKSSLTDPSLILILHIKAGMWNLVHGCTMSYERTWSFSDPNLRTRFWYREKPKI